MAKKAESVYNEAIRKSLEDAGAKAIKLHGNEYMKKGNPDIVGCWNGFFFAVETKLEGEEPDKKQAYELREWDKVDAICVTAVRTMWQPNDVVEFIRVCITDKIWWHRHGQDHISFPQPGSDGHFCVKVNNESLNSPVGPSESGSAILTTTAVPAIP